MASSLTVNSTVQSSAVMEGRKNTDLRAVEGNSNDRIKNQKAQYAPQDTQGAQYEKKAANNLDNLKKGETQENRTNKKPSDLTAIEKYNNRSLSLDIDRDLNIVLAKIIDKKSGEVVKQIPPEEMVALMKYLKENPGTLVSRHS